MKPYLDRLSVQVHSHGLLSIAVDRMVDKINKHEIVYDTPKNPDEVAEELVNRGAALSGGAGVTGEDFGGVSDRQRLVRRST